MSIVFNIDLKSINTNTSNLNTDNWDSLKHLNLVIAIEEEFNVNFNNDEILLLTDFNKIIEVLNSKIK